MNYSIDFASLVLGEHRFDFEVDKSLFDKFENEDILGANIKIKVDLLKEERMLTFNFNFKGTLNILCDRCLDPLDVKIKGDNTLFVKFGDKYLEEKDDVIIISNKEDVIDLSQHIYECILLSKPMKCVHEISKCNSDIVERINKREEDSDKSTDPRWNVLRNIKFE